MTQPDNDQPEMILGRDPFQRPSCDRWLRYVPVQMLKSRGGRWLSVAYLIHCSKFERSEGFDGEFSLSERKELCALLLADLLFFPKRLQGMLTSSYFHRPFPLPTEYWLQLPQTLGPPRRPRPTHWAEARRPCFARLQGAAIPCTGNVDGVWFSKSPLRLVTICEKQG